MTANMNQVYGSIFLSPKNRVLVVKGRRTGKWSFPKGHPNQGETGYECARRETKEETGLDLPPFFERILHLSTGSYYVVRSPELPCRVGDPEEIMDTAWLTFKQLQTSSVNIDINTFLREHGAAFNGPPTKSMPPKYIVRQLLL
jgi:8-oxo-dGTP pyrophosphatase MutT (NUDIX family)